MPRKALHCEAEISVAEFRTKHFAKRTLQELSSHWLYLSSLLRGQLPWDTTIAQDPAKLRVARSLAVAALRNLAPFLRNAAESMGLNSAPLIALRGSEETASEDDWRLAGVLVERLQVRLQAPNKESAGAASQEESLSPEAKAILFVQERLKSTGRLPPKSDIAKALDMDRTTLYKWRGFKTAYAALQRQQRGRPAKGKRDKDGNLEAWRAT